MFDVTKFEQAEISQRTKSVAVPLLKDFFGDDDEPMWEIIALTAEDVAVVNEAQERNKSVQVLVNSLIGGNASDKADAIKSAMGLGDELPADTARRIEALLLGSVNLDPAQHRDVAIKIATFYPTVFMTLTNAIFALSGEGGEVEGKH